MLLMLKTHLLAAHQQLPLSLCFDGRWLVVASVVDDNGMSAGLEAKQG